MISSTNCLGLGGVAHFEGSIVELEVNPGETFGGLGVGNSCAEIDPWASTATK